MEIQFKSTKNQLPKDGEYILYIKRDKSLYYSDSPLPVFAKCEWSWYDGDGGQLIHDEEYSLENTPEGFPFLLILDGEGHTIWTNETTKWNPEIEHLWWIEQDKFDEIWNNAQF